MSDNTPSQPTPDPTRRPEEPTAPEPTTRAEPTAPVEPPTPAEPSQPVAPSPTTADAPATASASASTSAPATASTPNTPETPVAPSLPTAPGTPAKPSPSVPNLPVADSSFSNSPDYNWQPAAPTGKPERAAKRGNIGIIAALAVGALVGGASGAGVYALATGNTNFPSSRPGTSATNITVNDPGDATLITAAAAAAAPSVVTISVAGDGSSGSGSGVILSGDGYTLTNAHVATLSGATADPTIQVQMSDGRLFPAELVGSDPIADLAVIKIDADIEFQPAEFADSAKLNVGDTVVAVGAPLGLSNTVTSGIVSALNRSITVASSAAPDTEEAPAPDDGNSPFDFWEFDNGQEPDQPQGSSTIALPVIQTDAAINPGNSGGALLDTDGRVIGINVAIAGTGSNSQQTAGNIGVGFAIPSNFAKRISAELIENGEASHGLLGASVADVTEDTEISSSATVGSSIQTVTQGGAADKAGLRKGDVVVEFNGMPITGKTDLTAQVRVLAGGSDAELSYVRNGKTETVTVTLGKL